MAFDVNNFVIDHVIRGLMTSTADGSVMWSINQITDPSLSVTSETAEAVDAMGSTIATFNRGKSAEFTANNSLFDLGLYAAQNGVEKEIGTSGKKVKTPAFETITIDGSDNYTLKNEPVDANGEQAEIKEIYQLKGDGTLGIRYKAAAASESATEFKYNKATHQIVPPTGLSNGAQLFVVYDYMKEDAVAVTGDAINFPKAGKFIMEVLGSDVCDPTTLIHAYIVFPNAKLDANVDMSFTTDGNHPFTLQAQQSYCDSKKTLFQIVIPKEA